MKRIFLFLVTNIAVMVVIGIIFNLLGLHSSLASNGVDLDLKKLLLMSAIIGSAGSVISLFMSKWSAKRGMGVVVIEQPQNQTEQWLMDIVARQAQQAGIGMPEVGIFESPEPNAFATGASRDNALVAVSTGLLHAMSADEVEAVVGHEISHVANGDMITMALMQGVVNTFVYFSRRLSVISWTTKKVATVGRITLRKWSHKLHSEFWLQCSRCGFHVIANLEQMKVARI